jgi:hypothetical protein
MCLLYDELAWCAVISMSALTLIGPAGRLGMLFGPQWQDLIWQLRLAENSGMRTFAGEAIKIMK